MECEYGDEFFRSVHEAEFDRHDKHDSADSFLLAVVTLLGGVGFYYLDMLPIDDLNWWRYTFLSLAGLFALCWTLAVICLTGSIVPRYIGYLSHPKDLDAFATALAEFHSYHAPGADGKAQLEKELRAFTRKQYVKCAAQNREGNQRKTKWQTRTKICCIVAVFVVLFNVPFAYMVHDSHLKTDRVKLVDLPDEHKVRIVQPPAGVPNNGGQTGSPQTNRGQAAGATDSSRNRLAPRRQRPILNQTR